MLKVALSHDVDKPFKTYQYVTHSFKNFIKSDFKGFYYQILSIFKKNPYWGFPKIIDIENKYNVKSTFFFLNETIPFQLFKPNNWKLSLGNYDMQHPEIVKIIKYLDINGWEIGLHGSYNSYNNKSLLIEEKQLLEKIVGHKVVGIRQHYLNLDNNTWALQKNAGFVYDSTFGYKNDIGFKDNHYSFLKTNEGLVIVPLIIMDSCLMSKSDPWEHALKIINETEQMNACLVINWHQRVFNEYEFPYWGKIYIDIIEECKRRNATFKTIGQFVKDFIKQ